MLAVSWIIGAVIPQHFISDLIARADIVEVIGRYVQLKKGGINHKGLCPFHGEKSPSFTVSAAKQFYHCFGCGVHGTVINFLMEYSGLGYVDAIRDLAGTYGMVVPEERASPEAAAKAQEEKDERALLIEALDSANQFYRQQLKGSPRAIAYLKNRGVNGQVAARFGLGYAPDEWQGLERAFTNYAAPELEASGLVVLREAEEGKESRRYDRLRDRVTFPIRNARGDLIGFGGRVLDKGEPKYLNSPETPVFHKGEELYGLFEARQGIRDRKLVLVVEGYMDVVALAQHGFDCAVATLGTACTPMHVQKLFRHSEAVVFSFDGDTAGRRAARRALEASLPHASDTRTVKFLFLPTEHDPDSYVRDEGTDAFERQIANAMPLSNFFLHVVAEGCALSTAEGRALLVVNAKPLLLQLPPGGALRVQLLQAVAQAAQMNDRDVKRLVYGKDSAFMNADAHNGINNTGDKPRNYSGKFMATRPPMPPRRAALTPHERATIAVLACPQVWPQLAAHQQAWLLKMSDSDSENAESDNSIDSAAALMHWLAYPQVWPTLSKLQLEWQAKKEAHSADKALALEPTPTHWLQNLAQTEAEPETFDAGAAHDLLRLPAGSERFSKQAQLEPATVSDALAAVAQLERIEIKARSEALAAGGLASDTDRAEYRELQSRLKAMATA